MLIQYGSVEVLMQMFAVSYALSKYLIELHKRDEVMLKGITFRC